MAKIDRSGSRHPPGFATAEQRYGKEMRQNLSDAAITMNQASQEAPQDAIAVGRCNLVGIDDFKAAKLSAAEQKIADIIPIHVASVSRRAAESNGEPLRIHAKICDMKKGDAT